MRKPSFTRQFEKDLKRMEKRGKALQKIKEVMGLLIAEESLGERYRDHILLGNYKGRRECHLEPNWLLIYKLEGEGIIFERTGTHSDLFE
jgi:mRNA interferase YafQ